MNVFDPAINSALRGSDTDAAISPVAASIIFACAPTIRGLEDLPDLRACLAEQSFPDFEVIMAPGRADSWGRDLNAAVARSSGEVLIFGDQQLQPEVDWVYTHITAHRPSLAAGSADLAEPTPRGVLGLVQEIWPQNFFARTYGSPTDILRRVAAYATDPESRWRFWGSNSSVLRSVFDELGGFDESLSGQHLVERDFGYRLILAGCSLELLSALETPCAATTSGVQDAATIAYEMGQSCWIFEQKHGVNCSGPIANQEAWSHLISDTSGKLDFEKVMRRSGILDHTMAAMPQMLARRAIAQIVDASHEAGYLRAQEESSG